MEHPQPSPWYQHGRTVLPLLAVWALVFFLGLAGGNWMANASPAVHLPWAYATLMGPALLLALAIWQRFPRWSGHRAFVYGAYLLLPTLGVIIAIHSQHLIAVIGEVSDWPYLLQLRGRPLFSLWGALIGLLSFSFYSIWAVGLLVNNGTSSRHQLVLFLSGVLLGAWMPTIVAFPVSFPLHHYLVTCLFIGLLVLLANLLLRLRAGSPAWMILWLSVLSVFVAMLLAHYLGPWGERQGLIRLFSQLLALFTVAMLAFVPLNRWLRLLPARPERLLLGPPSLRRRIQLSTILLTMLAFAGTALATVVFIRQSASSNQQVRLLEKVETVAYHWKQTVVKDSISLAQLAAAHRAELGWYDTTGMLLLRHSSSPLRVLPVRVKRRSIGPIVLQHDTDQGPQLTAYARLSGKGFLSATTGPISPAVKSETGDIISNLLNLYIFLLLIASAAAILVSRSIAQPLLVLGDKLRNFRLGQHEPLAWRGSDEIGQLIHAYNDMAQQLTHSTEQLKRSEREGAWREMAKQVAHEIKNPLTPMKLGVQHLQRTQKEDPERGRTLVDRVAKMLLEQIDSLARIATSFSHFARMPEVVLRRVDAVSVIQSARQLFPETDIELSLPEDPVFVQADREQLLRILTNLLKNGQQAIPSGREPRLRIRLTVSGSTATIAVVDNGTGIPPELHDRIFEPNFTTKSSGMGLGLALCKNSLTAMNGTLTFETVEGEGTRFLVGLEVCSLSGN